MNLVSEINKCNYCVDAHSIMVFGTEKGLQKRITSIKEGEPDTNSEEDQQILWALQNLNFDSSIILDPPFSKDEAPELIGTAVLFHYINRMVNLFAGSSPLPIKKMKGILVNFAARFIFAKAIRKKKIGGESLMFIDENIDLNSFDWANNTPRIRCTFQYYKYQTENKIGNILSPELITVLKSQAAKLHLLKPGFGNKNLKNFLVSVEPDEGQIAEFCFLSMFEPHKVYEKHIRAIKVRLNDEEVLQVASFVSMLIAESIGKKLFSYHTSMKSW